MRYHVLGIPGEPPRMMIQHQGSIFSPTDNKREGEVAFEWETDDADARVTISADGDSLVPFVMGLDEAKVEKWRQVKSCRYQAFNGGCDTPKGRIETDAKSQQALTNAVAAATYAPLTAIPWTMLDNSIVAHSAAELKAAFLLVQSRHALCQTKAAGLRQRIDAATTMAALAAIDITQDWPD